MRKATTNKKIEKRGSGWIAVASLAVTLAAFGCTTNRYPGNGEPTSVSPSYGPMNPSLTPGSSSGTSYVPMSSSYTGIPRVNTDALAILAAEQGFRGRILGPVNPGGVQTEVPVQPFGGQFVSPAMTANPQQTVNSSISSEPTPVITGGPVGGGVTIAAAPTATTASTGTTVATTGATSVNTGAVATTGALTTSVSGTTVAGSATFAPVLMNSTPAPQATGTVNPTLPTMVATGRATTARTTSKASTAKSTSTSTTSASKTSTLGMSSGLSSGNSVRIESTSTGAVVVTNLKGTVASTKP